MTIRIMEYDQPIADLGLVGGKIAVKPTAGNDWVYRLLEDLRGERSDEELFNSLVERLTGRTWAGVVEDNPVMTKEQEEIEESVRPLDHSTGADHFYLRYGAWGILAPL